MRRCFSRWTALGVSGLLIGAMLQVAVAAAPPAVAAGNPCGPPVTSVIACENTKPGDPTSDWLVSGNGDTTLQGFATQISVNAGQTVTFKIDTASTLTAYHIDILRLGWYGGEGATKVVSDLALDHAAPQVQPGCLVDNSNTTGLIDCGNWAASAHWDVPATATSGVYEAHLVRNDTGGSSAIVFVVRNDASHSDIVFQTSDETWEAYNTYGGNSLYSCTVACPPGNPQAYKAAYKVSYNRPLNGFDDSGRSSPFYAEFNMIEFMESNGYDVSYMAGTDVDSLGTLLRNHKIYVDTGHDEYWTANQRANVQAARDAGVNLAFLSGNEMFWKTRLESSPADGTAERTLVTYKETHLDAPTDPQDPPTWTGTWQDPRFSPPADGGRPQNALTGQLFIVNSGTHDITVPASDAHLRIYRNTPVASLTSGSITLGAGFGTLGYEWDEDADNGYRPAGEFDLSSTTGSAEVFTDYGSNTNPNGTATHHLTLYKAASGALVFGAGSVQFVWGVETPNGSPSDPTMQQMMVNLFADMGNVQPATLISGLMAASPSADHSPPTSTITSPAPAANLADGSQVTITGTASDSGGGVVAGVEVSTDGGGTWHPATGTTNWSYTWTVHGHPDATIRSRAVDDSANLESPSAGTNVTVSCPCSIFGTNPPPSANVDSGDASSVNVGMKFTSDASGPVTGVRFYKAAANTGTHTGSLWSSSGALLAQGTFSGESASGWQQMTFSSPVTISAGTTYVVSYFTSVGHYSLSENWFYPAPSAPAPDGAGVDHAAPLHPVLATASNGNGVYAYGSAPAFPDQATTGKLGGTNYWVDVLFSPSGSLSAPGAPTSVGAVAANASAQVTWTAPGNGGSGITSYAVTPHAGATTLSPTVITGNPPVTTATVTGLTNGTSYTFTVTATNAVGTGPASVPSNAVVPIGAPAAPAGVVGTPGNGAAGVQWTPGSSGGSAITSYTVTAYTNAGAVPPPTTVSGNPPPTSVIIHGLTNNAPYTFTVTATNGVGTSPASAPSNVVVPNSAAGSGQPQPPGAWMVASDGGIFALGSAGFYGSKGGQHLDKPIVGMAPTGDGRGYWLVASDGGIFAYGDAPFYGSKGGQHLDKPILGMTATPAGHGYIFVASDGGIFNYGDAHFYGSLGGLPLSSPVVAIAATKTGLGYRMAQANGSVVSFGDASTFSPLPHVPLLPIVGMATSS